MNPPTPSPDEPARRGTIARWWLYGVAGLLFLIVVASICIPVYGTAAPKSQRWRFLAELKGIFPALKMYAGDNGGKFPPKLSDLEPDYLKQGLVARLPYKDPTSDLLVEPLYFSGYTDSCPPETILLASTIPAGKSRLVVFADGSAQAMLETKYQELLKHQPPREW